MKIAIIGGGVIGLSTAWELSSRDHDVTVIDCGEFGRKASWAGAGILLPGNAETAIHPLEHLEAVSNTLHESWSKRLLNQTRIDNGYRKCGGIYVAMTAGEIATLAGSISYWQERKIKAEKLCRETFSDRYPAIRDLAESEMFLAAELPHEAQICNPWHVKALVAACENNSVRMISGHAISAIETSGRILESVTVAGEKLSFDSCVFACGAWTQQVTSPLVDCIEMVPVRGQMILYRLDSKLGLPIINEGTRYIVPRDDGHVLVGATIEEAGFDESTTEEGIAKLAADAKRIVPQLTADKIVKTWAGLRPGTHDGFPYMGRLPGFENAFVSTGHFKIGLQLSPGSAVAMSDLMEGKQPAIDLTPFDPSRVFIV